MSKHARGDTRSYLVRQPQLVCHTNHVKVSRVHLVDCCLWMRFPPTDAPRHSSPRQLQMSACLDLREVEKGSQRWDWRSSCRFLLRMRFPQQGFQDIVPLVKTRKLRLTQLPCPSDSAFLPHKSPQSQQRLSCRLLLANVISATGTPRHSSPQCPHHLSSDAHVSSDVRVTKTFTRLLLCQVRIWWDVSLRCYYPGVVENRVIQTVGVEACKLLRIA